LQQHAAVAANLQKPAIGFPQNSKTLLKGVPQDSAKLKRPNPFLQIISGHQKLPNIQVVNLQQELWLQTGVRF